MGYQKVTVGEKVLEEFPGLTQGELDAVNDMYDHYLFYEKSGMGRLVSTSCCHQHKRYVGPDTQIVTPEDRWMLRASHGETSVCPFCGKPVTVQNIGTARSCTKLRRFIPVVFLNTTEDGNTVYAQCYWTLKDYNGNYAAEPRYAVTRVYRFRRGEALQWGERWADGDNERMVPIGGAFTKQPFDLDTDNRAGYHVLGVDCLEHTFLRYTQYQRWESAVADTGIYRSLVRYLGLAARYPESVEMLMKARVEAPVKDYVYGRIKNSAVLHWGEKDPRKAFHLGKEDLRTFLDTDKQMETLYVLRAYRRAGMQLSVKDASAATESFSSYDRRPRKTAEVCAVAGVKPGKLVRYLDQYTGGCHAGGYRSLRDILNHWWDYINAAKELGYDMKSQGVLMPRDLQDAHDNAAALLRRKLEERLAKENAERNRERRKTLKLAKLAYAKRVEELRKRYAYSGAGYSILVPDGADAIIVEGKTLSHCVAGYAERHMTGKVTILFLRKNNTPDTPLVTIEMDGNRLVQAHGYKNEHKPCAENSKMLSPRVLCADILDPWLAWVAAGSKRDKDGRPKLPKKKEVRVA